MDILDTDYREKRDHKYICDPEFLSQIETQELIFKYKYLNESITYLADFYRLDKNLLQDYFYENNIYPIEINKDNLEQIKKEIEQVYLKNTVLMAGLALSHSITVQQYSLAIEKDLLESTAHLASIENEKLNPDLKQLKLLAEVLEKVSARQIVTKDLTENFKNMIDQNPEGTFLNSLSEALKAIDGNGYDLPNEV